MFFFFLPLPGHISKMPCLICPKIQDTQLGGCCIHDNCRFTTCFTPCRVYHHQDASNPRQKNYVTRSTPTACSQFWLGRKPPKMSSEVNSPHTPQFPLHAYLYSALILINRLTIGVYHTPKSQHRTSYSNFQFHKAKQTTDAKGGTFLQPEFKQRFLFSCA